MPRKFLDALADYAVENVDFSELKRQDGSQITLDEFIAVAAATTSWRVKTSYWIEGVYFDIRDWFARTRAELARESA